MYRGRLLEVLAKITCWCVRVRRAEYTCRCWGLPPPKGTSWRLCGALECTKVHDNNPIGDITPSEMVSLHRFSLQDGTHERSKVIGDLLVRDGGFLEPPNLRTELGVAQRPHGTYDGRRSLGDHRKATESFCDLRRCYVLLETARRWWHVRNMSLRPEVTFVITWEAWVLRGSQFVHSKLWKCPLDRNNHRRFRLGRGILGNM